MLRKTILLAVATAGAICILADLVSAQDGRFQVAAGGSCRQWYSTCAARCKSRSPNDANCVSDHCAPKLEECRASGCWQEGSAYGGAKHCGLSK